MPRNTRAFWGHREFVRLPTLAYVTIVNPRILIPVAAIALLLGGCSATASGTGATAMDNASISSGGLTIGQEAAGFTGDATSVPTPTSSAVPGWAGTIDCPSSVEQSLRAAVDKSAAGAAITLTREDPKTVSGPAADPQLSAGDIPTCAFIMSSPLSTVQEQILVFRGIPKSFVDTFEAKLVSDGFTPGASQKKGVVEESVYSKGIQEVELEYNPLTLTSTDGVIVITG
jgi:hypothetical protein